MSEETFPATFDHGKTVVKINRERLYDIMTSPDLDVSPVAKIIAPVIICTQEIFLQKSK